MNLKKKALPLLVGAVALPALLLGPTGAASAATNRSDACGTNACGSATLSFQSAYKTSVNMSVKDPYCNGYNGYIHLKVWHTDGTFTYTTKRYDTTGGNACDGLYTSYNGLSWTDSKRISRIEARVGDDSGWSLVGNSVDNPYT